MSDPRTPFDTPIAGSAAAMGLLYSVCYLLWVVTGLEALGIVPPAVLFVVYLSFGGVAESWRCRACGALAVRRTCPRCGTESVPAGPSLERAARYTVIVPAGALVVEFLIVVLLEATFQSFGHVSVVSWYRTEWYGTVGLFGPIGLFLLTLTAPIAYLFSVGVTAMWAVAASVSQSSR